MSTPKNLYIQTIQDDFASAVVNGLTQRFGQEKPEDMARVWLIVNTMRSARRIKTLLQVHAPCLLPKITPISEIATDPLMLADLPPKESPLTRKLIMGQMLEQWRKQQPDLLPARAIFDLADSLLALLDELDGQAVPIEQLDALDMNDHALHWQRAQQFFAHCRAI